MTSSPGESPPSAVGYQSVGFLIEMSLDWIVLRASENAHRLLDQSHVTLIDEPLGKFVRSQPLHDLRNLFSRLSGTTGIARAYRVRLTDLRSTQASLEDVFLSLTGRTYEGEAEGGGRRAETNGHRVRRGRSSK